MQIITTLFPIGTDLTITTDGNVVARNTDHLNLCSFDNHNISVSCPSNSTLAMSTLPPADFNKELISSEFYSQFQNPFQTFISSLEILAFILSITNMLVYSQKRMRSPTSCYLIAYSAAEILAMSVEFVKGVHARINPNAYSTTKFYLTFGIFVLLYVRTIITRFMLCLTCLVSVERFFAIAYPLNAKQFRVVRSPLLFTVVTFLSLAALHVNILLMYDVFFLNVSAEGFEVYSFRYTQLYVTNRAVFVYWAFTLRCVLSYSMLILLFAVNTLVVISLRVHNRQHQLLSLQNNDDERKKQKQEHQLTVTILVSTFLKVFLNLPLTTTFVISDVFPKDFGYFGSQHYTYSLVYDVSLASDLLSFVTDFLCYVFLSSVFRSTLRDLVAPIALNSRRQTKS